MNPNQQKIKAKLFNKLIFNGVKKVITEIKKKNVLNLPNFDAGKPSFVEFLRLEMINSLNKINEKDQKGIKLFLQRKVKGIKQNTLSLKGSRIAPNLVLRLNFLAINPSK